MFICGLLCPPSRSPASHSLAFPQQPEGGKNQVKCITSQDRDRDIAYWLPKWTKQTNLVESWFSLLSLKTHLNDAKHRQKLNHSCFEAQIQSFTLNSSISPPIKWVREIGNGRLWSVHNSSFSLLSSHNFPLLQCGSFLHVSVSQDKPVPVYILYNV